MEGSAEAKAPRPSRCATGRQDLAAKEFGRTDFDNVAYVRLEDNEAMARLFDGSLEPDRILRGIAAQTGESIAPVRRS